MRQKLKMILVVLSAVLAIELTTIITSQHNNLNKLSEDFQIQMKKLRYRQEKAKNELEDEFQKNKYLASGKNAYERIYNKQDQTIIELINNVAGEAFPENWHCETKVEEFTNFILLAQTKQPGNAINLNRVIKYLTPVITYTKPYLKNIAVFDEYHKCHMFFNVETIEELRKTQSLAKQSIANVSRLGKEFTRYNSIRIDYKDIGGHMIVPVIIGGAYEVNMLLDTGASTTMISAEVAGRTSYDEREFKNPKIQTFSTAGGAIQCPIVQRKVSIGGIDVTQTVAVNLEDNTNLLGVDFFKNFNYMIDTKSKCVYVWSK